MIDKTTIKFEDMPRALAYLIEKVEELNCKLESHNETSAPRQAEWMGIKWNVISEHFLRNAQSLRFLPRMAFRILCSAALF